MRALFAAADVFVLPTAGETMGFAIIEAMAAGLPVISTRVGELVPEVVDDGTTGILVPPGDVAALTGALKRLAEHPELRREMGAAGRRRARQLFDERVNGPRVLELVKTTADAGPGRRRGLRRRRRAVGAERGAEAPGRSAGGGGRGTVGGQPGFGFRFPSFGEALGRFEAAQPAFGHPGHGYGGGGISQLARGGAHPGGPYVAAGGRQPAAGGHVAAGRFAFPAGEKARRGTGPASTKLRARTVAASRMKARSLDEDWPSQRR